ncbi:MAG: hypothetical protein FWF24_04645 [Alphaproteobacteria bacterium]|nr:hypothetical protein [Alphaproteobacteria bacterium]
MTLHATKSLGFRPLHLLLKRQNRTNLKVGRLSNRLGFAGLKLFPSLRLRNKIAQWMLKLVALQEKEQSLINEIEAVENLHRNLRLQKSLRRACAMKKDEEEEPALYQPTPRRRSSFGLALLILALAFSPTRKRKPEPV